MNRLEENGEKAKKYKAYWENKAKNLLTKSVMIGITIILITVLISMCFVSYRIDKDKEFVKTVSERAYDFTKSDSLTDFSEVVVKQADSQGVYTNKIAKIEHKEIYYLESLLIGLLLGSLIGLLAGGIYYSISGDIIETHLDNNPYENNDYY